MALRLVLGPANAGKTGEILRYLERTALDEGSVLAVPESPDALRAGAELAAKGFTGIRVMRLRSLIEELWLRGGDGRRPVSAVTRAALARQATMDSVSKEWLEEHPGFLRTIERVVAGTAEVSALPHGAEWAIVRGVVGRYWELLKGSHLIEFAQMVSAENALRPGVLPGRIALSRFDSLSSIEEEFLLSWARHTDVLLALTWVPGSRYTCALDDQVERLRAVAGSVVTVDETGWSSRGLEALGSSLLRGVPGALNPDELQLLEMPTEESMVVAAAERACDLHRTEQGTIAVLVAPQASYTRRIVEELTSHCLEVADETGRPFGRTALGGALLALVGIASGDKIERASLLPLIGSRFIADDGDRLFSLDAELRARRLSGPAAFSELQAQCPATASLIRMAIQTREASGAEDWAKRWERIASSLVAPVFSRGRLAPEDIAAHRVFLRTTSEFSQLDVAPTAARLSDSLRSAAVRPEVEREGAVVVVEPDRVGGRRFAAAVIVDVDRVEQGYAMGAERQIDNALGGAEGVRSDRGSVARLVLYRAVSCARRRLVLIRRSRDERGENTQAGNFWQDIELIAGPGHQDHADDHGLESARQSSQGGERARVVSAPVATVAQEDLGRAMASELARIGEAELSVTELERYIQCPYRWYADMMLRPRELDSTIDTRHLGTLAHDILHDFYVEWWDRGHSRVTPESLAEALHLVGAISARASAKLQGATRSVEERVGLSRANSWARSIIVDDAEAMPGFEPFEVELEFGEACARPFEIAGCRLRGRIDRIDRRGRQLVVTDYKSTAKPKSLIEFEKHGSIQPLVYAAVARDLLDAQVAAACYRSLTTLNVRGVWDPSRVDLGSHGSSRDMTDEQGLDNALERLRDFVASAHRRMLDGDVSRTPISPAACAHCLHAPVCEVGV